MAKILEPTDENLRLAREFLRSGGVVAIPTETVYGLAANALDAKACEEIYAIKGRPAEDPLICHTPSFASLEAYCAPNEAARSLADAFWPGPLTLVLPKKPTIPDIVTAGLDSVAVRSPNHPVFKRLIADCDFPLAAPSANPFAYISPTSPSHVQANLGSKIDYIIDGGPCQLGVESTIVDLRSPDDPRVLRYGALPVEDIERALQRPLSIAVHAPDSVGIAPGSLPRHYSPKTSLELRSSPISESELDSADPQAAFLLLRRPARAVSERIHWLSEDGNLNEIAANLFSRLRELDSGRYERIIAEEAQELGLGLAINDRLRRAAFR